MPVVAVVEGVKIVFYTNKHPPAHFHALIAEHRAVVDVVGTKITAGSLPAAKRAKVLASTPARKGVLLCASPAALTHEKLEPIE